MALSKAAGVIRTIALIQSRGKSAAGQFWDSMPLEDVHFYRALLPASKLPIEKAVRFFELAVPVIYPDKPMQQGLEQLGFTTAESDLKGIYKILLHIASVEMVIKQAAVIWKTYHDQGTASVKRLSPEQYLFTVENYPDLPRPFLTVLNGYLAGIVSMTGTKIRPIVRKDADPNAWQWLITVA